VQPVLVEGMALTPLIVYITRPDAYEIYMGGDRSLRVWLEKPYYSHQSWSHTIGSETHYTDIGWIAVHSTGQKAKLLLKQDKKLREIVWHEVFLSLCPRGMSYERGVEWADTAVKTGNSDDDVLYAQALKDKEWEANCNTCHKRFLLQLNLRTYEAQRIAPEVALRHNPGLFNTDQIDAKLAIERYHSIEDIDDIPF
jgi:hypothetical protein